MADVRTQGHAGQKPHRLALYAVSAYGTDIALV